MHPWKKIIRGSTEKRKTKACFFCLERIQDSDDEIELKLHMCKVHSVKVHLKELVEMCTEAEEREEREGWSLDDILEEERDRREAEARESAEEGGWMGIFLEKNRTPECLDNNVNVDEVDCFLCQDQLKSFKYDKHLEKQHGIIFGVKDIKKAGNKYESVPLNKDPDNEKEKPEPEAPKTTRTDADTVKNLVEMKFMPKKKKIRLRTHPQRLFSRKYQVLIEEVCNYPFCTSFFFTIFFNCNHFLLKPFQQEDEEDWKKEDL